MKDLGINDIVLIRSIDKTVFDNKGELGNRLTIKKMVRITLQSNEEQFYLDLAKDELEEIYTIAQRILNKK